MAELLKKLSLLTRPSLRGSTGIFQKKIFFLRIFHNLYESTQFLTLIPNLILVLNQRVVLRQNLARQGLKMHKNCILKPNSQDMSQMTSSFGDSQMPGFVASQKDYRKIKTRSR